MAKPKLALIPATQGSKLYSVLPADGVGDFNFSRNSAATRINKDGLIETVASGVSRLNYPLIDGVVNGCPSHLLEPERLQKIQYSEAFDNAYWTKSGSSVVSGFTSPKGDLSAFKFIEGTGTGTKFLRGSGFSQLVTDNVSLSIYAKAAENKSVILYEDYSDSGVIFNLETEVITAYRGSPVSSSMDALPNGWYKLNLTVFPNYTISQYKVLNVNQTGASSYTGDGTSGVYIFGAQLEEGSYPTSYIPNYGTSAGITRVAETANGAGDASTFNSSEGVLMLETKGENDETFNYISLSDGGTTNYAGILYTDNDNQITYRYYVGGSGVQIIIENIIVTNFNKIAIKYKANDFAIWINGIEVGTASSGSLNPSGTFNQLAFARGGANNTPFYGSAKQIQYFDSALNDSDLETLTSWTSFTDLANGQLYSIK